VLKEQETPIFHLDSMGIFEVHSKSMLLKHSGLQVSVVFLLDASEVMPSAKEWPQVWEQQEGWKQSKKEHAAALKAEVAFFSPTS